MKWLLIFLILLFSGCREASEPVIPEIRHNIVPKEISLKNRKVETVTADHKSAISIASRYMGFHERRQRHELKKFTGVDPVRIDWCAAFVNAVLAELNIPGSDTVSDAPLTARSFLRWGVKVGHPQIGDVVVLPRGTEAWQGHVGFYYGTVRQNGRTYYQVLAGNQSNSVTIALYPAWKAISIRRAPTKLSKNDK
jgi:uncharacterized protein (TIGR02594 family)